MKTESIPILTTRQRAPCLFGCSFRLPKFPQLRMNCSFGTRKKRQKHVKNVQK